MGVRETDKLQESPGCKVNRSRDWLTRNSRKCLGLRENVEVSVTGKSRKVLYVYGKQTGQPKLYK